MLNGEEDDTQGGVIIFVTDGKQSCNGGGEGSDINHSTVINRIKKTKVRIITVAFGLVIHLFLFALSVKDADQ